MFVNSGGTVLPTTYHWAWMSTMTHARVSNITYVAFGCYPTYTGVSHTTSWPYLTSSSAFPTAQHLTATTYHYFQAGAFYGGVNYEQPGYTTPCYT